MNKELCCINCPHCELNLLSMRLHCKVSKMNIPLEKTIEELEKWCIIRAVVRRNQESPHCQKDDCVELNDGRKSKIYLVEGYNYDINEYKYKGSIYIGNHTFSGITAFKQSDIKRKLTMEELFKE